MANTAKAGRVAAGSGFVLSVLASGQFLMTLDSSVMNVSIRQVAADVGTTVTGIQTAITLYTLVMASLMITGGKIGAIVGRRRAFSIGLVIYGAGSLTTALVLVFAICGCKDPHAGSPNQALAALSPAAHRLENGAYLVLRDVYRLATEL